MNEVKKIEKHFTACPHDCPSTCALEVEKIDDKTIGRVRGSKENSYTDGVVCAKVARYAERVHHPDRLLYPMKRNGPKGSGQFERISWDEALDEIVSKFNAAETEFGSESVWPIFYAGTMGLVQRDGIERIRHAKKYSGFYGTVCIALAWPGYTAGTGQLRGADPREMAESEVIVLWGNNAVNTQVNVMTHALKARKKNGAKIVAIDVYNTGTVQQSDMGLILKPGTDGALACAAMHIAFRDGYADRDYMDKYADDPKALEEHLKDKTPEWAAEITGLSVEEIEEFAKVIGTHKKTFFRLGYGFTRSRNGATSMHAVNSIPVVLGSWQYLGGGSLLSNSGMYGLDGRLVQGRDLRDKSIRILDQSRMGDILCNDPDALKNGVPVKATIIQNTNPMAICPDLARVKEGFMRDDLFVAVHEQFMTDTAKMADILLPATTFVEHDDIYKGGGHTHVLFGPKIIDRPGECRTNHEVYAALAERLGIDDLPGMKMSERELIDDMLDKSYGETLENLENERWIDKALDFETAHFLNGFAHEDGKFHFKADWVSMSESGNPEAGYGMNNIPGEEMPVLPDHWDVIENATEEYPYRLVTAPARNYLNSSFTETPTSIAKEIRPTVIVEKTMAEEASLSEGDLVRLSSARGSLRIHVEIAENLQKNTLVVESIWPNNAYLDGMGINILTGADPGSPVGGAAYHDNRVSMEKCN
ncbi:molybdopterin-dependent oxidoreductase [Curvivirga aplysinae]|uniref:molybdopterin-dependent oxidoreductase n=1 Tax=Curvivirga aplysinae TaxID=2529852 RepID=UPI0012BC411D|nr:molybdopterin-dependent oxidoreductase [Curvivirga aplysinae]MTI10478.1 molybdopterin oxidoreductase family protein [Curvivirga aplysinae]